jgi:hypothetical protein
MSGAEMTVANRPTRSELIIALALAAALPFLLVILGAVQGSTRGLDFSVFLCRWIYRPPTWRRAVV